MTPWNMKRAVMIVAVAIGVCVQGLAVTAAGSRFDCTKPDHRDYTPGWTARHQSFNALAAKGDVDLVFLGDSITQGWERAGAAVWKHYYGPRKAANFGIDGDQTQHVLWRIDHGNFAGISPKLVVIMLGTNNAGHNTPGEVAEAMGLIVKRLREKLPATKLLLLGIFPRGFKADDALRAANAKVNVEFSKLADGKGIHYLDIGPAFLEKDGTLAPEIMPDGVHPTAKGYEIWAQAIEAKVAALLGEDRKIEGVAKPTPQGVVSGGGGARRPERSSVVVAVVVARKPACSRDDYG